MEFTTCHKCGKQYDSNFNFCPHCGEGIERGVGQTTGGQSPPQVTTSEESTMNPSPDSPPVTKQTGNQDDH